jgi:hypothetical protein
VMSSIPSSKGMSPSGLSTCGRSGAIAREPTRADRPRDKVEVGELTSVDALTKVR